LLATAGWIASEVNDPTFKSYLDMIDVPKSIVVGLALFGMVTYIAHGHEDV
jgi:hypothetical protein